MRNVLLSLAGVVLILVNTVSEASTQLNFTVNVIQSCTLSMSSNPLTVNMGKYPTSFFSKNGTSSPEKPFEIHISGCPNSKIALKWSGGIVTGNEYLLAVDGALGLGVRIINKPGNQFSTFTRVPNSDMFITMPDIGNYDFNLAAYYESYQDSVTAGPANASATVEVTYG
ncbi:fimbrial protein [Erwinia tasmaniensis]|uniref:Fimbrial-like protein n=1 Tax=Erwinia tasmaniensis (strain DSM 17950 / CFBP 7177 / CIP 109463 / NCPPB 4357 / Et1/99) TaxID=465817 RepID=B2VH46_ERWT9|nr:fimbrial protein [Erwinia tasmaniensis]CAO95701.1 Fimbrial-like protein [Erwinia tasmaniensis Et1/99]